MSEKLKEALSAVIDGEADEFELRRVLDEMGKDVELAGSWERYHLIGSVMRRERVSPGGVMRERVWAEIQSDTDVVDELVPVTERSPASEPARRAVAGRWISLGVAATVALAVVIGFSDQFQSGSEPGALAGDPDELVVARQQALDDAVALNSEVTRTDQVRTDAYKVYHMQQLGMNQSGFGGFARMVSYERK
jgi:sigma-E factor negative regulatory protein RseA